MTVRYGRYRRRDARVLSGIRRFFTRVAVTICFGSCTLDLGTRQLWRDGKDVHLSPKAFELLVLMVQVRPAAVSKEELQRRLWPDTFVAEANLSNLIAEIRAALRASARTPQYVRTVHKFGYAFCATVTGAPGPGTAASVLLGWLEWGMKRFALGEGEYVIGRDPGVDVRLDASTVSRRHARL